MQVEPLSWNRMKEAGGQTGRGIWGLLQGESSMAGSGEPVRRNQVRAGLRDDSFDEQAGSCSASGIRPRSERDCSSQPLSLLCLQEKIRALGPRPTCSFTLQLRGPRSGACTLLTHPHHPTSWLLQPRCSGARARAPGSPSVKCGARTWHPEHTFGMSQGGRGGVGILSFHFLCCPSAEPNSGHPAQSGGEGEDARPSSPSVFSSFSKTTSSDSSRRPEGVSAVLQGGGASPLLQTDQPWATDHPGLCMGVIVASTAL